MRRIALWAVSVLCFSAGLAAAQIANAPAMAVGASEVQRCWMRARW